MNGRRYSIIPAEAVLDGRLAGLPLRVLCLLGAHTDKNGWLVLKQTTMATALDATRPRVNEAIHLLVELGYVRKRLRFSETSGGQLASIYQVLMDREPPDDLMGVDAVDAADPLCPTGNTPLCPTGNTPCAPQGTPNKRPLLERPSSLREERARGEQLALIADEPPALPVAGAFEEWWRHYPHKVAKGAARRAFAGAIRKVSLDVMIAGIERYVATKPADRAFCNPATWLAGERWLDAPAAVAAQGGRPREKRKDHAYVDALIEAHERGGGDHVH